MQNTIEQLKALAKETEGMRYADAPEVYSVAVVQAAIAELEADRALVLIERYIKGDLTLGEVERIMQTAR